MVCFHTVKRVYRLMRFEVICDELSSSDWVVRMQGKQCRCDRNHQFDPFESALLFRRIKNTN